MKVVKEAGKINVVIDFNNLSQMFVMQTTHMHWFSGQMEELKNALSHLIIPKTK